MVLLVRIINLSLYIDCLFDSLLGSKLAFDCIPSVSFSSTTTINRGNVNTHT